MINIQSKKETLQSLVLYTEMSKTTTHSKEQLEIYKFVAMNSPWFLVYVIDTNSDQNKELTFCHVIVGTKQSTSTS